jgi:hypothetical protein
MHILKSIILREVIKMEILVIIFIAIFAGLCAFDL